MAMKPQSAKAKGRRLQQEVRDDVLAAYPELEPDDVRSTSMGAGGEDLLLSPAARRMIPVSFECKNQERINVWQTIKQAKENAPEGTTGVVVFRRNNSDTYMILPWDPTLLGSLSR